MIHFFTGSYHDQINFGFKNSSWAIQNSGNYKIIANYQNPENFLALKEVFGQIGSFYDVWFLKNFLQNQNSYIFSQ